MSQRKKPVRFIRPASPQRRLTPEELRAQKLEAAASHLIGFLEEMITTGAMRLPYPGVLEAIVDLKRALKP